MEVLIMKKKVLAFIVAGVLAIPLLTGCQDSVTRANTSSTQASTSSDTQATVDSEVESLTSAVDISVSPAYSWYLSPYDAPDDPNWALYAEITLTNRTSSPVTVENIYLYPNHMFYGEEPGTPVSLPGDATVELRDTSLWELNASQMTLDSCPISEEWNFGSTQLSLPLDIAPGQSVTGNVYIPGGVDMTTALPMAPYTLDVQTSLGYSSYYGMAVAPSGNMWGLYNQTTGKIDNANVAQDFKQFLEDSQLLLWLNSSMLTNDAASSDSITPTQEIYRMTSVILDYLTEKKIVEPSVVQEGTHYYSQDVFETVLYELTGYRWDCSGLIKSVETDGQEINAIPIWDAATDVSYSLSIQSQQDTSGSMASTSETAGVTSGSATVVLTYYVPSAANQGASLSMPGERPYQINYVANSNWKYIPFCIAGIEQLTY